MNEHTTPTDPKIPKWQKWIENIKEKSLDLMTKKHVFDIYQKEVLNELEKLQKPTFFHWWILQNYKDSILMGIRRQLDNWESSQSISLWKFLNDLKINHSLITKKWHIDLWNDRTQYDGEIDNLFDINGVLKKEFVKEDLEQLKNLGEKINNYAIKHIDHNDLNQGRYPLPSINEVNQFFKEYEKIVMKYILLFEKDSLDQLTPHIGINWEEDTFYKPWLTHDNIN